MFEVHIRVFQFSRGCSYKILKFEDRGEAYRKYEAEKKKDFHYAGHYRITEIFENEEEGA